MKFIVHGHFYQPPRENPWTEEVPRQPSAAPAHDWNERVNDEAYRPNAAARVIDEQGRVVSIVNNYAHLSFDMGPTLLAWLEPADPVTYGRIIDGDRRGRGGMAQGYGHLILPLATERDIRTQVRWGMADFEHRFGRRADGIWLPETAVNDVVLTVLAEEGVGFTILAPGQAATEVVTGRPYRWHHPSGDGRGVDIVFYDGGLSHTIAFELASLSSQALVARAIDESATTGEAVAIAADGETFGHHHKFGERLLAYAFATEAEARGVEVTNVAALLAGDEREREQIEVNESAWSCAHGVGRWREDCGCSTGGRPGSNQRWRAPLRRALDGLKSSLDEIFERRGKEVLRDPWAARDAYIDVLLERTGVDDFLAAHAFGGGDPVEALTLLEAERHGMSMFTSCGWFFHDVAGIETVQVLLYAARVLDLLADLGEDTEALASALTSTLGEAVSNDRAEGTGADIWARHVLPLRVDAARVVAHISLADLLAGTEPGEPTGGFDVEVLGHHHDRRGPLTLVSGKVALRHRRTRRSTEHTYAALHFGGLEVIGATNEPTADLAQLRVAFTGGAPVTEMMQRLVTWGGRVFDLSAALPGGAEHLLSQVASDLEDRFVRAYDHLLEDHGSWLEGLAAAGYPLPPALRAPAELALARRLEAEVEAQEGVLDPAAYQGALEVVEEAQATGVAMTAPSTVAIAQRLLERAARAVAETCGDDADAVAMAIGVLDLAAGARVPLDVEGAQEAVFGALLDTPEPSPGLRAVAERLGLGVDSLLRP